MSLPRIDNSAARRIFLDRHALAEAPSGAASGSHLLDLVTRLGFVQVDSINTLARAHDLILFARRPRYRPRDLQNLYEKERALFEHWTHDASVIPMEFYPWWQMRMRRDADALIDRWRNWQKNGFEGQFDTVLDHIRDNGPCGTSDVGKDEARSSGGWWDWHPSKAALEYLWMSGALTVVRREGIRKVYDLTERVIDECHRTGCPDEEETIDWCCSAALDRLGFATSGEIARFWRHVTMDEARDWCTREAAAGRIAEAEIEGADGKARKSFVRPGLLDTAIPEIAQPKRVRVLSPFDPALRDRARAKRLFGFDYTIEIFVPEAKRQYGYYVFPILEGDRLIGRVDMKAQRDQDRLHIRALWPERGIRWGKARGQAFEAELQRLSRLAGVGTVTREDDWLRGS